MAGTIDGAPADQGGRGRTRQQDCAGGLGHHGSRRQVQRAGTAGGSVRDAGR